MPSPKNARKEPPARTPEKGGDRDVDLGQRLATRKSQDFKSKIDLWNEAGGGVFLPQDAVPENIATADIETRLDRAAGKERASKPVTPKTPDTGISAKAEQMLEQITTTKIDPVKKAWVRRRSKTQYTISPDTGADTSPAANTKATPKPKPTPAQTSTQKEPENDNPSDSPAPKRTITPKKRLVSDEHWRKDRQEKKIAALLNQGEGSKPKEQEPEPDTTTPKPKVVRRSVVTVGLKVPPSVQDFKDDREPVPAKRRPLKRQNRSPSRSREQDARPATPDYESSGVKVYIKTRRKSQPTNEYDRSRRAFNTSETSLTAPSSVDGPSSATDITTPEAAPVRERALRSRTDPHIRVTRRLLSPELPTPQAEKPVYNIDDAIRPLPRRQAKKPLQDSGDLTGMPKRPSTSEGAVNASEMPPAGAPKVYGNRIEGWLAGMPDDPFLEPTVQSHAPEATSVSRELLKLHDREQTEGDGGLRRVSAQRGRRPRVDASSPEEQDSVARPRTNRTAADKVMDPLSPPEEPPGIHRSMRLRTFERENEYARSRGIHNEHSVPPVLPAGKRLAPIASISTLRDNRPSNPEESILSRASDGDEPDRHSTVLKRRLTKHSDLMSVLSLPRDDDHAIAPARSIRTKRPRHDTVTPGDLMNEVTTDELKYQRELRTLVDGVIPVLLQYVLSQNGNKAARTTVGRASPALTQPIVNMGVALERLKANHRRIPMHDTNELLLWAQNTARVYADYLNVWRLGFNDIVVNLAPAEESKKTASSAWGKDLQRNEHGDLLDGDGERVHVAYLLKRPLIRVKDLAKTLSGVNQIRPSPLSRDVLAVYEDLVVRAKQRTNDERARIEDEAAADIDPSRARDPRSLVPLAGVSVDPLRRVRARDFFDLEFFHSSGQQMDCKIEVIMRVDAPDRGAAGDVLFCEISPAGRWLLLPPVLSTNVSARKGDKDGELVVMIRGQDSGGAEWRELLSIHADDGQCAEWLDMLGTTPAPPRLTRRSSFNTTASLRDHFAIAAYATEAQLPIGEPARPSAPMWDGSEVNSVSGGSESMHGKGLELYQDIPSPPMHLQDRMQQRTVRFGNASPGVSELSRHHGLSIAQRPDRLHQRSVSERTVGSEAGGAKGYGDLSSSWIHDSADQFLGDDDDRPPRRPALRQRTSSVPTMDLPTVNKLRQPPSPDTEQGARQTTPSPVPATPPATWKEPKSAPSKLQKRSPPQAKEKQDDGKMGQAVGKSASAGTSSWTIPSFTPAFLRKTRRSSSPLKHEYEPSTASDSCESDSSDVDDNESLTSESSTDDAVSTLGELKDFTKFVSTRTQPQPQARPPPPQSLSGDSLRPSDSASQAPYRSVPSVSNTSATARSVACIFAWSDSGSWEAMHPEECQIFVTPGLIEAFDLERANAIMSKEDFAGASSPSALGLKPLVALELTPWVPLRRGTAVDISIRSPPTADSLLRTGSNIMFRSRSPEECEKLYNLINRARIDNPTWIALQNARGPMPTSNWGEMMERRNAARGDSSAPSWLKSLSRKGGSYRSKGTRSASVAGSQSSVGTMTSAFSALRQFGGSSKIFNIAKSTIMSKQSTRSSSDSLSSGAATPMPIDPAMGTPVGITNAKIRLYVRETTAKWRDLGNARLTIMLPPRRDPSGPADPRITGLEKRVLIRGKKDVSLLDVTLGESCFERVARTGIAVSVWEEGVGPNGELGFVMATGGVLSSKSTVYMLQMKSERDAAFTFSMVGKLRY